MAKQFASERIKHEKDDFLVGQKSRLLYAAASAAAAEYDDEKKVKRLEGYLQRRFRDVQRREDDQKNGFLFLLMRNNSTGGRFRVKM